VPLVISPGRKGTGDEDDIPPKLAVDSPLVHVAANQTARVDLTLKRGGTISGKVLFDDGMPLVRTWVHVEPASGPTPNPGGQLQALVTDWHRGTTDDEGRYRIVGLEPGRYRVLTGIPPQREMRIVSGMGYDNGGGSSRMPYEPTVYHPGTFLPSQAKVIEIKATEQIADEDIEIPIDSLHSIEGRVRAQPDDHALGNAMVMVYMKDEFVRIVYASQEGAFRVDNLPKGTYTVEIQSYGNLLISDGQLGTRKPAQQYQRTKLTVVIDDHDVVMDDVLLVEAKPSQDIQ
jgi:hypothetical protein